MLSQLCRNIKCFFTSYMEAWFLKGEKGERGIGVGGDGGVGSQMFGHWRKQNYSNFEGFHYLTSSRKVIKDIEYIYAHLLSLVFPFFDLEGFSCTWISTQFCLFLFPFPSELLSLLSSSSWYQSRDFYANLATGLLARFEKKQRE